MDWQVPRWYAARDRGKSVLLPRCLLLGSLLALAGCAGPSVPSGSAPLVWRHDGPGAGDDETLQAALAFCNDAANNSRGSFNLFPLDSWEMNRNGCMAQRGWTLQRSRS